MLCKVYSPPILSYDFKFRFDGGSEFTRHHPFDVTVMNSQAHRFWKVLCWNVWGINLEEKWSPIRDTLAEGACDIFCLQETKKENFDLQFIRNFSPPGFDSFEFLPSIGASGGLITIWKSSIFSG